MKNYLITGISKGLGLETAKTILKQNSDISIYGLSRSVTSELKELKLKFPSNLYTLQYDLEETKKIKSIIFEDFLKGVPISGFVNNAAIAYDDIITNMDIQPLDKMFKVNVYTPMLLTKYCIRNMLLNKIKGSIVHISSISVHTGYKGLSMYASSKGALEAFSKNTAREWGSLGIRSNTLVSGFMDTNMSSTLSNEQKKRIYNRTSLKMATDITSVANTIEFLLSENSKSITGQNIHVDSGTI